MHAKKETVSGSSTHHHPPTITMNTIWKTKQTNKNKVHTLVTGKASNKKQETYKCKSDEGNERLGTKNSSDRKPRANDIIMSNENNKFRELEWNVKKKHGKCAFIEMRNPGNFPVDKIIRVCKRCFLMMSTYPLKKLLVYRSTGADFVVNGCYYSFSGYFLKLVGLEFRPHYHESMLSLKRILYASHHLQNVNYPIACEDPLPLWSNHVDALSLDNSTMTNRTPVFNKKFNQSVYKLQIQ